MINKPKIEDSIIINQELCLNNENNLNSEN